MPALNALGYARIYLKKIKKSSLTEVDEYGVEDRKELSLVDRSRGEDEGAEARVGACAVN